MPNISNISNGKEWAASLGIILFKSYITAGGTEDVPMDHQRDVGPLFVHALWDM